MPFKPKSLKYGSDGVPIMNAAQIENVASELLQKYCPEVLRSPRMTPVADIISKLCENTGLIFEWTNLGERGSRKILGRVRFKAKLLSLDVSLDKERAPAYRFTAAHEIGHWILHRWNFQNWNFLKENAPSEKPDEIDDDEDSLYRLEQRTPRDWLEWQANVFASSLVLPPATFRTALIKCQRELGITKNLGLIFHTPATRSTPDYINTVARLSQIYGVSKTSVEVKVRTLELFREAAPKRASSAGEVLSRALDQLCKGG